MSSNKEVYRSELLRISNVVKISNICKEVGISQSAMSKFLNHNRDELISIEKLQKFFDYLKAQDLS
ncbi:MAG: hypothetical protein RR623_08235 [Bacilli bacterium]